MKRVLTFLAIMLLPLSVWAMTPVSDSDLSNVTGQAGVNINADLTMDIGLGTMAWGDATGVDAYPSLGSAWAADGGAGYVGVTGFNINNLRIKAREGDVYGSGYNTTGTVGAAPDTYNTIYLKPITIDVASGGVHGAGVTYVRFGLGSLQVTMDELSFAVKLGTTGAGLAASTQQLGTANIGAMGVFINPSSYVDIFAHGGSGVTLAMNIKIDQFNLDYISWGDTDGLGGAAHSGTVTWISSAMQSAGYIGLDNLSVGGPITITGEVAIDVVTSGAGIYAHGAPGTPVTVCHISFPSNFNVNVAGPIEGVVKLGAAKAFDTGYAGTLGDIYISAFNLDIAAGSWVDIWAH